MEEDEYTNMIESRTEICRLLHNGVAEILEEVNEKLAARACEKSFD